ncbi:MAG: hypothetical protein AAFQ94_20330 [Bacteroidota bacterium]
MKDELIERAIKNAILGDENLFNKFIENIYSELLPKLTAMTSSVDSARDVFIRSVQKFWERFVIKQEQLPENTVGYIFMMCKNAWLMQKRNQWNMVALTSESYSYPEADGYDHYLLESEHSVKDSEYLNRQKALTLALEQMSEKCKQLIETELDKQVKLKDLQDELGYPNYQSLVQAKYNCKKRLTKMVFRVLKELKKL